MFKILNKWLVRDSLLLFNLNMLMIRLFLTALTLLISLQSHALTIHTTINDLNEVFNDLDNIKKVYDDSEVLVVFDIDDTLLTLNDVTQDDLPQILKSIQGRYKTICLTARPRQLSYLTRKQFQYFDLNFKHTAIGRSWKRSRKVSGLNRKIFYNQGVMFASNQNKGLVLDYLLQSIYQSHSPFKQIIFIDDKGYNTQDVYDVFQPSDIEIAAYQYLRK